MDGKLRLKVYKSQSHKELRATLVAISATDLLPIPADLHHLPVDLSHIACLSCLRPGKELLEPLRGLQKSQDLEQGDLSEIKMLSCRGGPFRQPFSYQVIFLLIYMTPSLTAG